MCACHKNHSVGCIEEQSNFLLENKTVSALIWRHVRLLYTLFTQICFGLLFSYFTITDVTSYAHHKFPVSFLLYIATKKPNHYCKQLYECSYNKKITLARFACLCLLRSTKLGRPKQILKSQFSVGPFADSVCVVSS